MRAADIFGVLFGWTVGLPGLLPWMPAWLGVALLLLCIAIECLAIGAGFLLAIMGIRRLVKMIVGERRTGVIFAAVGGVLVGLILIYVVGFWVLGFIQYVLSNGGGGCPSGEYCGPTRYE